MIPRTSDICALIASLLPDIPFQLQTLQPAVRVETPRPRCCGAEHRNSAVTHPTCCRGAVKHFPLRDLSLLIHNPTRKRLVTDRRAARFSTAELHYLFTKTSFSLGTLFSPPHHPPRLFHALVQLATGRGRPDRCFALVERTSVIFSKQCLAAACLLSNYFQGCACAGEVGWGSGGGAGEKTV